MTTPARGVRAVARRDDGIVVGDGGRGVRGRGFTLIELLTALLVLSLLAVMSYRGLDAVLQTRARVAAETERWQRATAFFARFERDVGLATARPVRAAGGDSPAWIGRPAATDAPRLEWSRAASNEGGDAPRRVGYRLDAQGRVELWIWAGLDLPADHVPARHPLLDGVSALEFDYLDAASAWVGAWPATVDAAPLPRAVRVRLVFAGGEDVVRVFAVRP